MPRPCQCCSARDRLDRHGGGGTAGQDSPSAGCARELGRAPIIRNTLGEGELRARFPPGPPETSWPITLLDADRVVAVLEEAGYYTANPEQRKVRRGGVKTALAWLADQRGESRQQRWKSSGAEPPAADGCAPRWPGMTRRAGRAATSVL